METQRFDIKTGFARRNKIPLVFVAKVLAQTPKALYVYGRGSGEPTNFCMICGRTLTHPVSVLLGIGPECGSHYWDWKAVGGYTEANIEKLKSLIPTLKIDQWIPRSVVKSVELSNELVMDPPENHPVLIHPMTLQTNKTNEQEASQPTKIVEKKKFQDTGKPALKISFPFDRELVDKVKTLEGRRYVGEGKFWTAPYSVENIEKLKEFGFHLEDEIEFDLEKVRQKKERVINTNMEIPGLKKILFPFQKAGVGFIESRDGRALLADEMGLGKTVQALAWLQLHRDLRPAVIVVPASLKLNWARECEQWLPDSNYQILSGTSPGPIIGEILIINYDILSSWADSFKEIQPKVIILDECHLVKNNSAQRTKAVKSLVKRIPHVIALSGTPIINRPVEFFNAIKMIDPMLFPSFWTYAHKFCGAKHNGYGWDFGGATKTDELHKILKERVMIRRLKKDVLTELPDKTYSFVPIQISNAVRKEYDQVENSFISWVKEMKGDEAVQKAKGAETLVQIEAMKQVALKGKMEGIIDWIKNFLDVDGKLVVFATHRSVIETLEDVFRGQMVKIDGSTPMEGRQAAVDLFQNNHHIRLFVGNIKAAGVGITLTASSNVAFIELPWTPGELSQAEDRCHRIGQKNAVQIHYLLASGTIDEDMAYLIDKKRKVLDQIMDGKETDEEGLIGVLFERLQNKRKTIV